MTEEQVLRRINDFYRVNQECDEYLKSLALFGDGIIAMAAARTVQEHYYIEPEKITQGKNHPGDYIGKVKSNRQLSNWVKRNNAFELKNGKGDRSRHRRATVVEAFIEYIFRLEGSLAALTVAKIIADNIAIVVIPPKNYMEIT